MTNHHGARTLSQVLVFLLLGGTAAWMLLLPGCGGHQPLSLPPQVSGALPDDYRIEPARGIAVARITVVTQGEPGLGPFTNPLYVQLHAGDGRGAEQAPVTVDAPPPGAYVLGPASQRPSVWRYAPPGLMAISLPGGRYDALAIAYPDAAHATTTPTSIPQPSSDFRFAPVEIPGGEIVYLGDIEIAQTYTAWQAFADTVQVRFTVTDNAARTLADFRARYPQFADAPITTRLLVPAPGA